ncbi:hypothetical protein AAI421_21330 [Rhodococcus aetherivorans]|uniref:hypothetical protein n=1 Tax=Rhodococcus aetherivorans TaxID=191292 RepID=UPI0031D7A11D
MKLTARSARAVVEPEPGATRPVLLRFAGLHFAMTATEARTLADQLHDAAEETDSAERTSR